MDIVYEILDSLSFGLCSYLVLAAMLCFLHCFYDQGFQWGKKKAIWLLVFTIADIAVANILFYLPIPDWLLIVIGVPIGIAELLSRPFFALYDYKGKRFFGFLKYLGATIVFSICMGIVTGGGITMMAPNFEKIMYNYDLKWILTAYLLFGAFLGVAFYCLYFKLYKKNIVLRWTKRERLFVLIYSLFGFGVVEVVDHFGRNSNESMIVMGGAFMIMATLIPFFYFSLCISRHFQERTKYQEAYMQAELEHFQQYKLAQEETARFRHDTKNHLLCVSEMLKQGKEQEANDYLKEMLDIVENLSTQYVTGDEILDSVVAAKAGIMVQKGIAFELDGVLAGGLDWKPVAICNVFANAIDNAIEACEKLPRQDRTIAMRIRGTTQFWFIRIENPVLEEVDTKRLFKKTEGYTSKADQSQHGIGTYNMKHTVESYGGGIQAQYEDQKFILEIMIHKK